MNPRPFTVHHSGFARDSLLAALRLAAGAGRRAEGLAAARTVESGLLRYADGFGESRQPLHVLGQLLFACILPISVWFAVDITKWEVQVSRYRFVPRRPHGSA